MIECFFHRNDYENDPWLNVSMWCVNLSNSAMLILKESKYKSETQRNICIYVNTSMYKKRN